MRNSTSIPTDDPSCCCPPAALYSISKYTNRFTSTKQNLCFVVLVILASCVPWNSYASLEPRNEIRPLCSLEFTCPVSDGGIFNCIEDIPDPDFTAIHILDSC